MVVRTGSTPNSGSRLCYTERERGSEKIKRGGGEREKMVTDIWILPPIGRGYVNGPVIIRAL